MTYRKSLFPDSSATKRCLLFGHHWQLESSSPVNPNRLDLGVTRTYYCARCLTRRKEKS